MREAKLKLIIIHCMKLKILNGECGISFIEMRILLFKIQRIVILKHLRIKRIYRKR